MKKFLSLVLALSMVFSLSIAGAQAATSSYTDVSPDASYADEVERLTEAGIMDGMGDGKFQPGATVTRAMAITVLGRMAGATKQETDKFVDVTANSWYSGYVGWAVENGIVNGMDPTHFNPDREVTSDHLNLMLSRYAKVAGIEVDLYDTAAETVSRADMAQRLVDILDAGETPSDDKSVTTLAYADTTNGGVMGYTENGVSEFYGIPFAQAERFQMPTAPEAWNGYKTCMMQGEVCPQNKTTMEGFDFMAYSTEMVENEDTMLNLNVFTTSTDSNAKKPVIVWIHGGGYTTGGSMEKTIYEGSNLAGYGDVVFVSPNHRLNVLGYLDLSAYGEEYEYSGNVGIADLVFALEWVQDNIANFGGDPNNVTIVGQSGGGSKVTTLMGMPAAQGLFDKAVAISGGSAQINQTSAQTQAKAAEVLAELGITADNIEDIETIDYETLLAAYNKVGYSAGPTVDGEYIPTGNYELSKDIPFMCGNVLGEFSTNVGNIIFSGAGGQQAVESNVLTNISEAEVLTRMTAKCDGDADKAAQVIAAFKEAYPGHNPAEVLYINNRTAGMSAIPLATAMESYGGTVYSYIQAASYPFFNGIVAIHTAGDIPLWFHNVEKIPAWVNGETAKFEALSDQMSTALVTFAKTGNPSTVALKWDPWTTESDAIMVFDDTNGNKSTMRTHHEDELFELLPKGGGFPF